MEIVYNYQPDVLENEVPVFRAILKKLFKEYEVYVFGYGSLLYADGWNDRGMLHPPQKKDLIECTLNNFERGPWGLYNNINFYGIIPTKSKKVNGVVTKIWTLNDWANLMNTEVVAGLHYYANYRVVDVTDNITGWKKKPKGIKIHCVVNRPINRTLLHNSKPYPKYYNNVWEGIQKERTSKFNKEFLKLGGFKGNKSVTKFINTKKGRKEMKTKNFPGRKNARRDEAVTRIEESLKEIKNTKDNKDKIKRVTTVINNTKAKIISQSEALSINTKKFRGGN